MKLTDTHDSYTNTHTHTPVSIPNTCDVRPNTEQMRYTIYTDTHTDPQTDGQERKEKQATERSTLRENRKKEM